MNRKIKGALLFLLLFCVLTGCGAQKKPTTISVKVKDSIQLKTTEPLVWESEEDTNLADLLQKAGSGACVSIEAGGLAGSGLIYDVADNRLVIVTAAHVLEQAPEIVFVTFSDGLRSYSRDYLVYSERDLAMIAINCDDLSEENLENDRKLLVEEARFETCKAEDVCISMGGSETPGSEAYEGKILAAWMYLEDYRCNMSLAYGVCDPGMSGGGLFDSRGYFLGVLSGFDDSGRIAVVPLPTVQETVHDFLSNS